MITNDYRILLVNLYHDLNRLKTDYDSGFDELINGMEIMQENCLEQKWILDLCSKQTIMLLNKLRNEWLKILRDKPYSCIGIFMQLDEDWNQLVEEILTKVIQSIYQDLINHKVNFEAIEQTQRNTKINFEELLKIVNHISRIAIASDSSINPFYQK